MNRMIKYFAIAAVCLSAAATQAHAQKVQSGLSDSQTSVGDPVQLQISVVGGQGQVPQQLSVDGLDIQRMGESTEMQMNFGSGGFNATTSTVYTYLITPLREGTFTIPAISVPIDGKVLKTAPQTLRVGGAVGGGGTPVRPAIPVPQSQPPQGLPQQPLQSVPGTQPPAPAAGEKYFGEMIIPKKSAYVGEVIPIEMRFYFNTNYQFMGNGPLQFSGDGFTVMKILEPSQRRQDINGIEYEVLSWRAAIQAAKAGPLEVPAASMNMVMQAPMRGMRSFGGFLDAREITVSTRPVQLEVKALPREGRPDDFSGAIGQFRMEASASPKNTAANDPVSFNVVIAGRGNFEAMGAPTLLESDGWRTYPPSEKFEATGNDEIGYIGKKKFDYMILARTDQAKTPVVEFSFFDPDIEKYVTIKNGPFVVNARGSSGAAAAPATVVAAATATPTPSPQATPAVPAAPQPVDALVKNFVPAQFTPIFLQREFLIANGALAVVWSLALVFALGRLAVGSAYARKSTLRREARQILRQMEDERREPTDFFQRAEEFLALQLGGAVTADAHAAVERSSLSEEKKAAFRDILARNEELKYSSGFSSGALDPAERKQVLDLLKPLS